MTERPPLPRDTIFSTISVWLTCPWCAQPMDDATIRLEDLVNAWIDRSLARPWRGPEGQRDPDAVTIECAACARPSMLALQQDEFHGRYARLLAVRTDTDVKLLGGVPGRPLDD